ncbi:hypothetical protein Tco_1271730 [Tanacetum coccineum]
MLEQFESSPEFGGASGSGGCEDDKPGGDEDDDKDGEDDDTLPRKEYNDAVQRSTGNHYSLIELLLARNYGSVALDLQAMGIALMKATHSISRAL